MKAKTIKRLRSIISKEGYYEERFRKFPLSTEMWYYFIIDFCTVFVGEDAHEYIEKYKARVLRLENKHGYYCKKYLES